MRICGRFLKVVVCILLILGFCGCWDSRELNKLAIVMGMGIDKGNDPGTIQFTAQVIDVGNIRTAGSNGGGGGQEKGYVNFEDTGNTVFSTIRNITNQSSRKLYFAHNQVLIFGRSAAEEGISKYLDFFLRDPETRLNVYILVAQDSAGDVLNVESNIENIPAQNIKAMIEEESTFTSQTIAVHLSEFKDSLLVKTKAAVAPIVEISQGSDGEISKINGTAVFKGDKLVGTLNKTEGRGLLWVLGKVKSGIIEARTPQGNLVCMETVRAEGKFSPEIIDGKVKITITIREEGNIGEQEGSEDLSDLSEIAYLEQQKQEVIQSEVMAAIQKAQELDADIFGFGESIHQKYPKEWTSMESQWDELFPEIEVEIHVDAKLRLLGRINTTVVSE